LADLRIDLHRSRGQRKFIDVEKEGPPRLPGDVIDSDGGMDEEEREDQQSAPALGSAVPEAAAVAAPADQAPRQRRGTESEPDAEGRPLASTATGSGMGTPTQGPARSVQMPYPFNRSGPYLVGTTY
jgi:hypothetical protein